MMVRYDRAEMRGKRLLPMCYRAKISTHEWGPKDKRKFCYGLEDKMTDEPVDECKGCGAFVLNAQPLPKEGE